MLVAAGMVIATTHAQSGPPPGFVSIFNGKDWDLSGQPMTE